MQNDEDQPEYSYAIMMGFSDIEDLIEFVEWVNLNFDSPEGLREWFYTAMDHYESSHCTRPHRPATNPDAYFTCTHCSATFTTSAGLELHNKVTHNNMEFSDDFWNIIKNSFKDHKETHDDLSGSD